MILIIDYYDHRDVQSRIQGGGEGGRTERIEMREAVQPIAPQYHVLVTIIHVIFG